MWSSLINSTPTKDTLVPVTTGPRSVPWLQGEELAILPVILSECDHRLFSFQNRRTHVGNAITWLGNGESLVVRNRNIIQTNLREKEESIGSDQHTTRRQEQSSPRGCAALSVPLSVAASLSPGGAGLSLWRQCSLMVKSLNLRSPTSRVWLSPVPLDFRKILHLQNGYN